MKKISILFVLALTISSQAFALPLPTARDRAMAQRIRTMATGYNFEGIVALDNCSASLIRLEGSKESDSGLVLTNGHCLEGGMPKPGVVVVNRPSTRVMWLAHPKTGQKGPMVRAREVVYSTMTNTDMTIYGLEDTYEEIYKKYGIRPFMLASRDVKIGESIEVLSGYWERGYACKVEAIVPTVREAEWTWHESIRYSRPGCEIIGGTSGSPVISVQTREVIGVNNTSNESGLKCTINNPCEVAKDGTIHYAIGISYAQQTNWLYSCMIPGTAQLDLRLPGCLLPKPNPKFRAFSHYRRN